MIMVPAAARVSSTEMISIDPADLVDARRIDLGVPS
jgi:hypothetical protein